MSAMTRAIRLSMPSPNADLKALADRVFATAVPAASQSMQLNAAMLNRDLFDLECRYDPGETWPVDWVAFQLAAWRMALSLQRLQLTFWSVSWTMRRAAAGIVAGLRAERFCDRHPSGTHVNCRRCALARRPAAVRAS